LPFNPSKTIDENFIAVGGEVVRVEKKNRYIYLPGDKRQVKDMRSKLKYPILPYPKGDNQRYDASYNPDVQLALF
jgi:hypothetical protein